MKSLFLSLLLGLFATSTLPLRAGNWFDGGDLSALPTIERLGGTFRGRDGGKTDAIRALAAAGANCVRLRLFVQPNGKGFTNNDLPYTIALAKRAKAAGQSILLDFHYSDTWADPGKQGIPKSWPKNDFPALVAKVESYTDETLRTFAKEGVFPELVQIGNEINNGLLWPQGRILKGKSDWDHAFALFNAASRGVRRGTPAGRKVRIVLHTATGGQVETTATFHREMQQRGLDYDVAGLSFYPWWNGSFEGLKENARQLATTFGKEVLVAETAFPWNEGSKRQEFFGGHYPWPKTPAGQAAFLRDVSEVIHSLPDHRGIGVIWWHPDSIPVRNTKVWLVGSCALWRPDGSPLPAIDAFGLH